MTSTPSTRHLRPAGLCAAVALGVAAAVHPAAPAHAGSACDQLVQPLYQQSAVSNGTSLVTPWYSEYQAAARYQFTQDGVLGKVATRPGAGLVAVHRFIRGADFVTAPASDADTWTARGYADQGVRFHTAGAGLSCGVAVHRVVRNGVHREALAGQVARYVQEGWTDVGTKYRIAPAEASDTPAPTPSTPPPTTPSTPPPTTPADADGRFSLAVVPDTQNETLRAGAPLLAGRNEWLVREAGRTDLRAVLHVGDMVNWDTPDHAQYLNAQAGMAPLERAGIPWVGAIGNHDTQATGEGGSARPGVDVHQALRDTTTYNDHFDASHFTRRVLADEGRQDNSAHLFEAGGLRWMVVVLELWPRQSKLDWATRVVAAHPDRNVILLTHDYLDGQGRVVGHNGGYGDLPVSAIREQLVAPHPNVKMVLSGHEGFGQVLVEDFPGHRVVALQQNYDTLTDALVRMVEVDAGAGTITHTYRGATTDRVVTPPTTVGAMDWVR